MSTTKFKGIQTRRRQTILLRLLGANTSTTNRYTIERINTIIEYDIETKRLFDTHFDTSSTPRLFDSNPVFDTPGWHIRNPHFFTVDDPNLQNERRQAITKLQRWYRRLGTKSITESINRTNSMLIPLLETYALPTSGIKRFSTPEERLKMLESLEMLETKILKRFDTNFNLQNKRLQSVTKLQRWYRRLRTEELQLEELLKRFDNPTPAQIKANEKIRKQNKEQSRLLHEQIYNYGWYGNTNQRQKKELINKPTYPTLLSRLLSSKPRTVKETKETHNDYTAKLSPSELHKVNEANKAFEQSILHEQFFGTPLKQKQPENINISQASHLQKRKLMHNELLHKTKNNKARYVFKPKRNSDGTTNVFSTPTTTTAMTTIIGTTGTIATTITMSLLIIYGPSKTLQLIITSLTIYMTLLIWEQTKLCKYCLSRHSRKTNCQHNPNWAKTYNKSITIKMLNARYNKLISHTTPSNWITRKRILQIMQPTKPWTHILLSSTKINLSELQINLSELQIKTDNIISEQELEEIYANNNELKRQQELKNSHDLFKTFEAIN